MAALQELEMYSVHSSYVRRMYSQLLVRNVDAIKVLAASGLTLEQINIADGMIDIKRYGKMINEAKRLLFCPWLGLELGQDGDAAAHGVVGNAATACDNLRRAVQVIATYGHLRADAFTFAFVENETEGNLIISQRVSLGGESQFFFEAIFATLVRGFQSVISANLNNIVVDLPFPEKVWSDVYRKFSPCQVRFGYDDLVIHFPSDMLDQACITSDSVIMTLSLHECDRLNQNVKSRKQAFAFRVADLLKRVDLTTDRMPELGHVAGYFCVSSRTLMRKLKEEGTSFQDLIDANHKELACWYLRNTNDAIEVIAMRLGYKDPTNFSRTFRRWYTDTPSEYRRRNRSVTPKHAVADTESHLI